MTVMMLAASAALAAGSLGAQGTPPEQIDILIDPTPKSDGPEYEDCSAEEQAATISGEIIVCRRKADDAKYRTTSREEAENRYARETMNKGNPQTPDVAGPGIFRGPATIGGICGIGLGKCPPPPAYMIDFASLPPTPPGSDADRVARGLRPIGNEGEGAKEAAEAMLRDINQKELGLPPALAKASEDAELNPAESASPAVAE